MEGDPTILDLGISRAREREATAPAANTVVPTELQVDDRLPYTTAGGKTAHVRVRRVDNAEVTMIRRYGAHERVSVKRA